MDENASRGTDDADSGGPPKRKRGPLAVVLTVLIVLAIVVVGVAIFLPATRQAREAARRYQCMNNLKQLTLALSQYAEAHGGLPPAHTSDGDGRPLHSWRTLILPYLGETELFKKIDLRKPWDDPVNAEARNTRVWEYECPSDSEAGIHTNYLAVVTPNSCLRPNEPRPLSEITDGVRQTLIVIEVDADHAVPWMSPLDADESVVLGIGPGAKLNHTGGVPAAFVDGHVEFLDVDLPAARRRAMISVAGGDDAGIDDN